MFLKLLIIWLYLYVIFFSTLSAYYLIIYARPYYYEDLAEYTYLESFAELKDFFLTSLLYCSDFFHFYNLHKFYRMMVGTEVIYHWDTFTKKRNFISAVKNRYVVLFSVWSFCSSYFMLILQTFILFYFNFLWYYYDSNFLGFQYFHVFYINFDVITMSRILPLCIGLDSLSLLFVILTSIICPVVSLISISYFGRQWGNLNTFIFHFLVFFIQVLLIFAFSILDVFFFFIIFEFILIPTFLLIVIYGSNNKKIKASYYIIMYTLFTSIFFLYALVWISSHGGSFTYFLFSNDLTSYPTNMTHLIWLFMFISLICKIPTFPFYLWLPEAHVEAPTAGSVILASLLLKLGGYGFLRFLLPFFKYGFYYYTPFIFLLFIISFLLASVTAVETIDIKKIIAYSSIAHMNFALLGLFSGTLYGLQGSILFFIGHGFVSAALFILIGYLYDRFKTRYISYFGGLTNVMPTFSTFFLFFSFANMAFPGTVNFVAEFLIISSLFFCSKLSLFPVFLTGILTTTYSIWLYSKVCLGPLTQKFLFFTDLSHREFFIIFFFAFFTLYFGLFPNVILDNCFINILYLY